jgi:hypothetical protein
MGPRTDMNAVENREKFGPRQESINVELNVFHPEVLRKVILGYYM